MSNVIRERFAIWNKVEQRFYFFQVDKPQEGKWQGYTFLKEQQSDNFRPVRDRKSREQILSCFERDRETALANYGKRVGSCPKCGKSLTDPESIERGIGPHCYKLV